MMMKVARVIVPRLFGEGKTARMVISLANDFHFKSIWNGAHRIAQAGNFGSFQDPKMGGLGLESRRSPCAIKTRVLKLKSWHSAFV
jgi:hypothetical protein